MRKVTGGTVLRLVDVADTVPLPGRPRTRSAIGEPGEAADEDEQGTEASGDGRGVGVGPEVTGRDQVLDLGRAGKGVHREGEGTEGDGTGEEPLGDIRLAK